uniref:Uncharacterized protein n=1 Tax=Globodera rostochiensis TaxID=31243 RepID=A0A914I372_GLORO
MSDRLRSLIMHSTGDEGTSQDPRSNKALKDRTVRGGQGGQGPVSLPMPSINDTRRALCRFSCRRRFPQTFLILRVYKVPSHKVLKRDRPFVLANAAPAVISAWKWHINKRLYSVGVGMSDR